MPQPAYLLTWNALWIITLEQQHLKYFWFKLRFSELKLLAVRHTCLYSKQSLEGPKDEELLQRNSCTLSAQFPCLYWGDK